MARFDYPPYYISAYGLAVRQGFEGTLDEWLASLNGHPGDRIEMRCRENLVQWRTVSHDGTVGPWQDLYTADGSIQLRTLDNVVQWRWVDGLSTGEWKDLYTITDAGILTDTTIEEVVEDYLQNVPRVTRVRFLRSGQTITASVRLEGDLVETSLITLDDTDRPVSIVTDGVAAPIEWEGF